MFSYLIIFEVNNRFVAFSIDKNFQKSTEIGSQFHNLPTAGCPNPLLPSPSPCNRLSLPASRLFLGQPRFFPLFLLATASPCLFPGCFSPAVSSCFRSFRPLPLNRRFPRSPSHCGSVLPVSRLFLSQPRFFPLFLLATTSPCLPPACSLVSPASSFSRSALPPPLNRCFLHSGGLFDALSLCPISFLQSKKDVPKARLFLQAFFYSLHSSSAAKTSGLRPNVSCQIPRILRPHQTSVRINMRRPENIICR